MGTRFFTANNKATSLRALSWDGSWADAARQENCSCGERRRRDSFCVLTRDIGAGRVSPGWSTQLACSLRRLAAGTRCAWVREPHPNLTTHRLGDAPCVLPLVLLSYHARAPVQRFETLQQAVPIRAGGKTERDPFQMSIGEWLVAGGHGASMPTGFGLNGVFLEVCSVSRWREPARCLRMSKCRSGSGIRDHIISNPRIAPVPPANLSVSRPRR